ncbi:MAG TPA: alpha/beta fold hydrolase [Rubrivivax sp.]|nr:alpha/beta fold hydrolase [Rubrivivax sp.]
MAVTWIDRMAIDVRGEGDGVVLVHGLGGSMNVWTPLLPALTRYRSARIELPGAARSRRAYALADSAPQGGRLSVEVLADAVIRVCQGLGLSRAHLVGHSLGTIVCQHVAVKAPGLVRSLSLFGAMAEPVPAQRENMVQRAAVAREQGMFEIAEAISEFALSPSTRAEQPVTVAYVRDSIASQDAEGFARHCIALAEAQAARAELIHCPVLVVNGDEDMVTPLSGARALAGKLAQARVEVLSRCGHWPTLERAAECQRFLRDFLDRVR